MTFQSRRSCAMHGSLAFVVALSAVAPLAEGMMKPHMQASGGEAPASLAEDAAGAGARGGALARRACAPQFDYLRPSSEASLSAQKQRGAEALDASLEHRRGVQPNASAWRLCDTTVYIHMQSPLVLPKHKLAFCYISKVGCTDFKDLFNTINGLGEETIGFEHDYLNSAFYELGVDEKEMTKENGWKFAAFTRDPALRYLSAYGDVCAVEDRMATLTWHKWSCCGEFVRQDLELGYQVEEFRQRVQMDAKMGKPIAEMHWAQQVEVLDACGGKNFAPENLDYWGTLSGDVNAQVTEMLEMVGYKNDTVVERFFPHNAAAGHTGFLHGEPSDYIKDLETLEAIVGLYEDDYRRFPGIGCSFTEPLLAKLRAANASSA